MAPTADIWSWNCNSYNPGKRVEVANAAARYQPLCILLSETKTLASFDPPDIAGYSSVHKPYLPRQSGIIGYFSNTFVNVRRRVDLELSPHVLAVQCCLTSSRKLILLACYNQEASGPAGLKLISDSIRLAAVSGVPFVAIGDLNATHPDWDPNHHNTAGTTL